MKNKQFIVIFVRQIIKTAKEREYTLSELKALCSELNTACYQYEERAQNTKISAFANSLSKENTLNSVKSKAFSSEICVKCGKIAKQGDLFCRACGSSLA